ncbi:MAG: T9SS type A sorting domain-containing protein, partial [candidate division Zixibacteria bacterium]|nr:T9SS type A sorting domain-containing protein [candidate division Zixibacteria bacterium]
VYCGDYPNDPCDSASFGFTVSGGRVDNGSNEWLLEGGFGAADGQPANVLVGAYPNPFNATVTINYSLPVEANVTLEIYNLLGRKVEALVNEVVSAGSHTARWDASEYASGIYYYKLAAGDEVFTKRVTLLK